MAVKHLTLTVQHWHIMQHHVQSRAPEEACGLLAGQGAQVTEVYCIPNVLHSPVRYRMEPHAQVRALHHIEKQEQTLLGIYHSHPAGPPTPSPTDVREAAYPGCAWLIWSPRTSGGWQCRAFRIARNRFQAIPLYLQLPQGKRVIVSETTWQGGSR